MGVWMGAAVWFLAGGAERCPGTWELWAALVGGLEHAAPAGSFPKTSSITSEIAQCLQVGFFMPLAFALPCGLLLSQNRFPGKKFSTRFTLKTEWQADYLFNLVYVPTNKLIFYVFDFWVIKTKRRGSAYQRCGVLFFMFCQLFL